jgi:NitT/TauT family transport system permease protein
MSTRSLFAPKVDIPRSASLALGTGSVAILIGFWCLLTYGGFTPPDFLAAPDRVLAAGIKRIGDLSLFRHIGSSLTVILSGFLLASIPAVPLGILMGSFRAVQAAVEPITGFMRYIPVSALIPLLILWIGIGIEQKIMVIFLGTFFQQLILISDVSARVSKDLIDWPTRWAPAAGRWCSASCSRPACPACWTICASPWAGPGPIWWWRSWSPPTAGSAT